MKNITVHGRTISFPKSYIDYYDKYMGCSLQNMAELYLVAEFKNGDMVQKLKPFSADEIAQIIKEWADIEIAAMGVKPIP